MPPTGRVVAAFENRRGVFVVVTDFGKVFATRETPRRDADGVVSVGPFEQVGDVFADTGGPSFTDDD